MAKQWAQTVPRRSAAGQKGISSEWVREPFLWLALGCDVSTHCSDLELSAVAPASCCFLPCQLQPRSGPPQLAVLGESPQRRAVILGSEPSHSLLIQNGKTGASSRGQSHRLQHFSNGAREPGKAMTRGSQRTESLEHPLPPGAAPSLRTKKDVAWAQLPWEPPCWPTFWRLLHGTLPSPCFLYQCVCPEEALKFPWNPARPSHSFPETPVFKPYFLNHVWGWVVSPKNASTRNGWCDLIWK